jgi:hypothetical protein
MLLIIIGNAFLLQFYSLALNNNNSKILVSIEFVENFFYYFKIKPVLLIVWL